MAIPTDEAYEPLIAEYLAAYRDLGHPPVPVGTRLQSLLQRLGAYYWREVEETVAAAVALDTDLLQFDDERRFRLDTGLLDPRLVHASSGSWTDALRDEMAQGDTDGIWSLSHWLSDRSLTYGVLLPEPESGSAETAPPVHEERRRLYESLAPFLDHLPGIPVRVVDLLRTGRLDRMLLRLASLPDARSRGQFEKLRAIREAILRQARRRCTLRQQLALFDAIEDLGEPEEAPAPPPGPAPAAEASASPDVRDGSAIHSRRAYLLNEIRLVRSLLRLGAPGSGVTRVHSVLAGHPTRFRRAGIADLVRLVHTCDPRLPIPFRMCVAPYTGTGFFEWDRDTVFVPLTPTRSTEDSILSAVAHYRLMIDILQDGGLVRRRYEAEFGRERVERRFLEDYRQWVLGVGCGVRGTFPDRTFEFFRDNIGPSAETLFAPSEIRTLAPNEAERLADECRQRIQQGRGGGADHYRLALLSWREGKGKASLEQMALAVRFDRANGCYLFTLGYLCSLRGMREKSREAYQACITRAPSTLWAVYAQDAHKRSD